MTINLFRLRTVLALASLIPAFFSLGALCLTGAGVGGALLMSRVNT
jgi:hypothetical protein